MPADSLSSCAVTNYGAGYRQHGSEPPIINRPRCPTVRRGGEVWVTHREKTGQPNLAYSGAQGLSYYNLVYRAENGLPC